MARDGWDPESLQDLSGRRYLVTGANAGLGFFSCLQLAGAGAHVLMTGRSPKNLAAAKAAILRQVPDAAVEILVLDTTQSASIRSAAASAKGGRALHGLLLNAGITHPPRHRTVTRDGIELVFATNVLGHYALAGELLTALAAGKGRMVWLGSLATRLTPYAPVDPELLNGYSPWRAYAQSKVATTALGLEADRRLRAARVPVASIVAHPGFAPAGVTRRIKGVNEPGRATRFGSHLLMPVTQSKEQGAWSLVRALCDPDAEGGTVWGPSGFAKGTPKRGRAARIARDRQVAARLWEYCQLASRTRWPYLDAPLS